MAINITYYSDCKEQKSVTSPLIDNDVNMKYKGFLSSYGSYYANSFDNIGGGLRKTRNSQGIIYCDDSSKLFTIGNGYVGIVVNLPYAIQNGIYEPLKNKNIEFNEHLLWGINVGKVDVSMPSVYAKLTQYGIEFAIWSSSGKFEMLDIWSSLSANSDIFFEFIWGNEPLDDFSFEDFGATMAYRINNQNVMIGNPTYRDEEIDNIENLNFCVLDTPYIYSNLEATLKKLIIANGVPSWLEEEWYSSSSSMEYSSSSSSSLGDSSSSSIEYSSSSSSSEGKSDSSSSDRYSESSESIGNQSSESSSESSESIGNFSSSSSSLGNSSSSSSSLGNSSSSSSEVQGLFQFSVDASSFTLPLLAGTHSFTVDWGDGSPKNTITAYNDPDISHTYSSFGTYIISMRGTCTAFGFNDSGDKTKMRSVVHFADLGFTTLNFYGCSGMTSIASNMYELKSLATAENMFRDCSVLTTIPSNIFDGATNITSFSYAFGFATGLVSIPTDLFRYNTSATNFEFVFYWCSLITSIPADLFRYNTAATNFHGTFGQCSQLVTIPTDLFRYNTAATNFMATFSSCTQLVTIPSYLFKYNILANTFHSVLYGCYKAQFNINTFYDYSMGEFSTRFLNKNVDFTISFARNSFTGALQGTAPNLWDCSFGSGSIIKIQCFDGAGNSLTSLSNYASIPAAWK